jgi:hypothetical protein
MPCTISLICTSAFAGYRELDRVTDPIDVKRLRKRISQFVPVFSISRDPAPTADDAT